MEGIKLRPCPFCGGEAKFHVISYKSSHHGVGFAFNILCKECGTRCQKFYEMELSLDRYGELKTLCDGREEAAAAWNQRAGDTP